MGNKGLNTQREIHSQPQVWTQTLTELSKAQIDTLPANNGLDQYLVTGCGSTYYISIWAANIIQSKLEVFSRPLPASELLMFPGTWKISDHSIHLLAISRSGTTSETVAAVKQIKENGKIKTSVVTCYPESELALLADTLIATPAAQEKSIAQTRSFTNMMLGISYLLEGEVKAGLPRQLAESGTALIKNYSGLMKDIANDKEIDRFFFLGSNQYYGLACEAMLKMKEMSLSYSEAYHFLEFRHGPMSMVNNQSLVVGLIHKENLQHELRVLKDMKELGGKILAIGYELGDDIPDWIDYYIPTGLSQAGSFSDVLYLPLLQILSFERARSKGLDPDNPHNLSAVVVLDL